MHLKAATALLTTFIDADIPAFLWGAPGIGKSAAVNQIAAERGWNVIDFRASTRDPVALMGLPNLDGDTTKWLAPDEFPQVDRDGAEGILFLDEINAAAQSMQAAMFGLVLDRCVGNYKLPPGWRVIAAGNRQGDRAAAQRMPSALANRFAHIDVDPDTSGGHDNVHIEYFNKLGVDPKLIAFLRYRPELIHKMPDANAAEQRAFPTPRSWEKVSKVMHLQTPAARMQAVTAIVGEGAAGELESFIRTYMSLPKLDDILAKPMTTPLPIEPSARFAVSTALARRVDAVTFQAAMDYINRLPRDFSILFTVDAVRRDPGLATTPTFVTWAVNNSDVVIG